MKARTGIAASFATLLAASLALPAAADVFGIFANLAASPTALVVTEIDEVTGAIEQIGADTEAGGNSSGVSAIDRVGLKLYFVANKVSESTRRIWTFDLDTETITSSPLITSATLNPTVTFLEYDPTGMRLLAIANSLADSGTKLLAELNPATGALTPIGSGFTAGGASSGVSAFDDAGGIFYYATNPVGGSDRALYGVNASTGALVSSPLINSMGGALNTTVQFLAYDPPGARLLTVANLSTDSSLKFLTSIVPATGAMVPIGSGIDATFLSSGVSDYDTESRIFYAPITAEGDSSSARDLFQIDRLGVEVGSPLLTAADPNLSEAPSFLFFLAPEPASGLIGPTSLLVLAALSRKRGRRRAVRQDPNPVAAAARDRARRDPPPCARRPGRPLETRH